MDIKTLINSLLETGLNQIDIERKSIQLGCRVPQSTISRIVNGRHKTAKCDKYATLLQIYYEQEHNKKLSNTSKKSKSSKSKTKRSKSKTKQEKHNGKTQKKSR